MFVTRLRRYYSYTILRDVLLGNIIYSEELYVYVIHTFYVLLCFFIFWFAHTSSIDARLKNDAICKTRQSHIKSECLVIMGYVTEAIVSQISRNVDDDGSWSCQNDKSQCKSW